MADIERERALKRRLEGHGAALAGALHVEWERWMRMSYMNQSSPRRAQNSSSEALKTISFQEKGQKGLDEQQSLVH